MLNVDGNKNVAMEAIKTAVSTTPSSTFDMMIEPPNKTMQPNAKTRFTGWMADGLQVHE